MFAGLFFVIICAIVGYYASTLGRNGIGWTFASLLFSPFLASLILLILGKLEEPKQNP